jgi:hypothetical protein
MAIDEDLSSRIRATLHRALTDLTRERGRERALEEWARIVEEHAASVHLEDPDETNYELYAALGQYGGLAAGPLTVPQLRHMVPSHLPDELAGLYHAIVDTTTLRLLHQRMGYEDPAGFMFDRFETIDVMTGGIGMVIQAYDPELDRIVALKLWMAAGVASQAGSLAEAKILARLTHPNVVTVHDIGWWKDRLFFVMEWIEGTDVREWLAKPRTWREVREVFLAAGEGLAAAHDAGIQHRDFKPDNILIGDDGRVVVADFGLADPTGALERDEPQSPGEEQPVIGTRSYVAPERLRRGRGDARSDQFSFCVALWEALHGLRPYAGHSIDDVLESIERGEISSGPLTPQVPHWLSRVVRKGLAEDPGQRFANMRELLQALRDEPPEVEESDAETDASVVGESAAGLLNAPAAGGPTWRMLLGATIGATLGAMVLGGLLVRGAMLDAFEHGRALERASRDQLIADMTPNREADLGEMEPSLAADMSNHEADMPCALSEYDPTPVDPVVLEVCQMIRRDDFEGANARWLAESDERDQAGRPSGADSLIIARTFSARVDDLMQGAPEAASEAARRARHWANLAADKLRDDPRRRSEALGLRDRHTSD